MPITQKVEQVSTTTRVVNTLRWGYEFTSLSGITQIRATNCKFTKCVWLLVFIIGFSLTAYQVNSALQTLLQYIQTICKHFLENGKVVGYYMQYDFSNDLINIIFGQILMINFWCYFIGASSLILFASSILRTAIIE